MLYSSKFTLSVIKLSSNNQMIRHFSFTVKGKVQGVNFRSYTRRKARALGLTGYVKNLSNGDVLIEAEGKQTNLYDLLKWLRTKGSPNSEVEDVLVEITKELENYTNFRIEF